MIPQTEAWFGPVVTNFFIALREISTHEELPRSQIEHMLNVRLLNILNVEIIDVKDARRRFDKASQVYEQACEKFKSLRKSTKFDVAAVIEEKMSQRQKSLHHIGKLSAA
ncbi:Adp-Ribosylation Factor Gtpaseactivating Protein [Trifolium repens]|nr:Adp-Ribosylation Factor Gtpaseactivating Protein [Trifolium repens]